MADMKHGLREEAQTVGFRNLKTWEVPYKKLDPRGPKTKPTKKEPGR
jgi:hypothetical protein